MEESKVSQPRQIGLPEGGDSKERKEQIRRWKKVQERYKHVKKGSSSEQDRASCTEEKKAAYNFCPQIDGFPGFKPEVTSHGRSTASKIDTELRGVDGKGPKLNITESLKYLSSKIKSSERVSLPQLVHNARPVGRTSVRVKRRLSQAVADPLMTVQEGEGAEDHISVEFKTKLPPLVPYKAITRYSKRKFDCF